MKKAALPLWLIGFLLMFAAADTHAAPGQPEISSFEKANRLYEQGKFPEAAAAYQELLESGYTSTSVYFNLGNACFKAGRLGQAVAAYRRAQHVSPRDPDIQANLQFAREQSRGPRVRTPFWQGLLSRISLTEWSVTTAVGLWAVLGLLTASQIKPSLGPHLRGVIISLSVGSLVAASCLIAAWYSSRALKIAVVTSPQTEVRHGPLNESQSAFTAYDGAELKILDQKDDWLQVTAGPSRTGWIRAADAVTL